MTVLKAILLTLFLIFIFSITQIGFGFMIYKTELLSEYFRKYPTITVGISVIIAYYSVLKLFGKSNLNFKKIISFKDLKFRYFFYFILIIIGLEFVQHPLFNLKEVWAYFNSGDFEFKTTHFNGFTPLFWVKAITVLVISPIFEELFFRRFLLKELLVKNTLLVAILTSSLCFSIIHIETPLSLIPAFIFGIISGLIFIKTDKIIYSIFLHFLINLKAQIFYVFDVNLDSWLLNLHFNYVYWILFLLGCNEENFRY